MLLLNTLAGVLAVSFWAASPAATAESSSPQDSAAARAVDFEPSPAARRWQSIVLHHSATRGGSVESIDTAHKQQKDSEGKPWLGIGYHFVIGNGRKMGDGEIRATFRWQKQLPGAHAGVRRENEHGIGICLIGDFQVAAPTDKQVAAVRALLKTLTARYGISRRRVLRHRDIAATLCPGRLFPWEELVADLPEAGGR